MKTGFIPIDNRPVCYTLPAQIAQIDKSMEFFMPERSLLGDLEKSADVEGIFDWLKSLPQLDFIILPLDTLAYGGLIPSRRCEDSFEEVKSRIYRLKEILKEKNAKIYAFSSIMRISNNNINEEEKEYWAQWGKKIFNYSYCMHKYAVMCKKEVPDEILQDYLKTRKRNFEINKIYLEWQKEGFFDTLVFSKDDCAQYGLNVQEAQALEKMGAFIKTGADEIPLTLLARAVKGNLKVCPVFLEPEYINLISNYEDVSVRDSVKGQLELAGMGICEDAEADILLYINNFKERQGEIVMKIQTEPFNDKWQKPEKPFMIADVRYANGADDNFVQELFQSGLVDKFFGYSAWNTTANTLGSLICTAKIKYMAGENYDDNAFKRLQAVRFLDDWAYQANVRQMLAAPNRADLEEKIKPFEDKVFDFLGKKFRTRYDFPWNRLFEVEVELN